VFYGGRCTKLYKGCRGGWSGKVEYVRHVFIIALCILYTRLEAGMYVMYKY